ncbi:MAG TPA: cytochrome c [Labilithrix sp.]
MRLERALFVLIAACTGSSDGGGGGASENVGATQPAPGPTPAPTPTTSASAPPPVQLGDPMQAHIARLLTDGRNLFRTDSLGSDAWFGGQLGLHQVLLKTSPNDLRKLGIGIDAVALPSAYLETIRMGKVDLDDPAITQQLLYQDAFVGLKGSFRSGRLVAVGVTCALCHSTVDDSFAQGIGMRRDGWPNRALDAGRLFALAPQTDDATRAALMKWGVGRVAGTPIPSLFALAGVGLATPTAQGSIASFVAHEATDTMHALPSRVAPSVAALDFYVSTLPAPVAPSGSYDAAAASRGQFLFQNTAKCASCHVPPLFTEPGAVTHAASEIGIEGGGRYRTTPLAGVSTRLGALYHDGRFGTLHDVIAHYETALGITLTDDQIADLTEYLMSL